MFRQADRRETDILDRFIYYRELGYSARASEVLSRVTYGDGDLARFARRFDRENVIPELYARLKTGKAFSPEPETEISPVPTGSGADSADFTYVMTPMAAPFEDLTDDDGEAPFEEAPYPDNGIMCRIAAPSAPRVLYRARMAPMPTDSYETIEEKGTREVLTAPTSTFRVTTATASAGIVFNQLRNGRAVDMSQVRIEELLNAFRYDMRAPVGAKFRIQAERLPKGNGRELVFIGVRGADEEKEHQNIVFLLDVSGSMYSQNEVTQEVAAAVFSKLRPGDTLSLVTYSDRDRTVLSGYSVRDEKDKEILMGVLMGIEIEGCTCGSAGITTAYEQGRKHYREDGSNQVILITDGDLNFGVTEKYGLKGLIEEKKKSGLFLSVIGTGLYNYKDDKLETLAKHGNGTYCVVNSLSDVCEFVSKRYAALTNVIAKDVKAQVEFNPKYVKAWRLLGYENRELSHADFRNDAVISEPCGSGGYAVALYEIERGSDTEDPGLRYLRAGTADSDEFGVVRVGWKEPLGEVSCETEMILRGDDTCTANARLARLVYCAAEKLRGSDKLDEDDEQFLRGMVDDGAFRNICGSPGNEEKLSALLRRPARRASAF